MSDVPPVPSARGPLTAEIVCRARGTTTAFPLRKGQNVVGSSKDVAILLTSDTVSQRHACFAWDGESCAVEDLGSSNGTFVNGAPVLSEKLRHLDVVTLGKQVDLVLVVRGERQIQRRQGILRATLVPDDREASPINLGFGELRLGRSALNCNVVTENTQVSKVHCRIVRTMDQLFVEDMGSSNGTFVNDRQVKVSALADGDVLSLGGVVGYRIALELGDVSTPANFRDSLWQGGGDGPQFAGAWKTRFEWESGELVELAELRNLMAPEEERGTTFRIDAVKPEQRPQEALEWSIPPEPAFQPRLEKPAERSIPTAGRDTLPIAGPHTRTTVKVAAMTPEDLTVAPAPPPIVEVRLSGDGFLVGTKVTGSFEIGRGSAAGLRVVHPTVSRRHALLVFSGDRSTVSISDAGGANGTRVNGVAVTAEPVVLADGDLVAVGDVDLKLSLIRGG